jgi:hypothetical protein
MIDIVRDQGDLCFVLCLQAGRPLSNALGDDALGRFTVVLTHSMRLPSWLVLR